MEWGHGTVGLGNWSLAQCIGPVALRHTAAMQQKQVVRHPGGSRYGWCTTCLSAAAAQVASGGHEVGLKLDPRAGSYRPGARVYLADECTEGVFNPGHFSNLHLLGRTLSVTIDLSAADCNCMVQWYLVPLRHSTNSNACGGDYYCDATEACGGQCDEIDLLEANQHALHSAIHHMGEAAHGSVDAGEEGLYNGYGGGRSQIAQGQYGPGGYTIDTRLPFRVHSYFNTDRRSGHLTGIKITLQQARGREWSDPQGQPLLESRDATLHQVRIELACFCRRRAIARCTTRLSPNGDTSMALPPPLRPA